LETKNIMQSHVVVPLSLLCFSLLIIVNLWNTKAVGQTLSEETSRVASEVQIVRAQEAECRQVISEKGEQLRASQRREQEGRARVKRAGDEGKRLTEANRRVKIKIESLRQAASSARESKGLHQTELVKLSKEAHGLTAAVAELKAEKEKMNSSLRARENN